MYFYGTIQQYKIESYCIKVDRFSLFNILSTKIINFVLSKMKRKLTNISDRP